MRFIPAIRAARFHKRQAWLRRCGNSLIVEIDRGAVELSASGAWSKTVAVRCGSLFRLIGRLPSKPGVVTLDFREGKLCVDVLGNTWKCPATLEDPPEAFVSPTDSTYLRPRKKKPGSDSHG
jgi:hypothetical protein